ncbi:MAG: hypothetical protein ACKOYN_12880 [Planctomycetota bacterium]
MSALRIVLAVTALAIAYGIAHDHVTVRIAPEYFTVLHPRIIESESPNALAFAWGFAATWWMGLGLGLLLAACCRMGARPKRTLRDVAPLLGIIVALLPVVAAVAAFAGREVAAAIGPDALLRDARIASERRLDVITVFSAHVAVEVVGAAALVALSVHSWRMRGLLASRRAANPPNPSDSAA